ncbi:L-2,4-diaminobutyrate decarboxylase [Leclercia adecarboxylata]|uniref:L-2,4-diaminobutyrate decarboxylase n=1 Tax=Leclercia adecarboxylata TaxID=83655 RepID=A0A4V6JJD1_9ENTR|nr:L-2,4-diaminobutyrate decarboxylase [Leclercia adecarboxylata]
MLSFARQGHSVQQDGLMGDLRKIRVLCSDSAHFSVQKNMALMGPRLSVRYPG